MHDDRFAAGAGQRRTGARDRLDKAHVAGERVRAGRAHFADDEDLLALVGFDRDGHLRIAEITLVLQPLLQVLFELPERQTTCLEPADERKRKRAVSLDRELA